MDNLSVQLLLIILYVYIFLLMVRSVMTEQELRFNPTGRLVAKMTRPLERLKLSKKYVDALTVVFILVLTFLFGAVFSILINGPFVLTILYTYIAAVFFIFMVLIVATALGSLNGRLYIPNSLYKLGSVPVSLVRKALKVKGNKISYITISLLLLCNAIIVTVLSLAAWKLQVGELAGFTVFKAGSVYFISSFKIVVNLLNIYFYLILVRVLMSWVSPDPRNQVVQAIYSLTEPWLMLFRRFISPIGMFDLSSIVALFSIKFSVLFLESFINRVVLLILNGSIL